MALTKNEATQVVEQYLALASENKEYDLAVIEDETLSEEFGWVFFYNTKQFLETGDFSWALGGNAPLIVDKDSGDVHVTGTGEPIEHYIEAYRLHGTCYPDEGSS